MDTFVITDGDTGKIIDEVNININSKKDYKEKHIGDLIPLEDFVEIVKDGGIIDYDGYVSGIIKDNKYINDQIELVDYIVCLEEELKEYGDILILWVNR